METVGEPDVSLRLVDEQGAVVPLHHAARWTRNDIIEAMSRDFGDYVFNAGFLQGWSGILRMGGSVRLVASTDDASYALSEIKWSLAPVEPVSFARWAFEMPTPRERLPERLTTHDGAIINALIERKIARRSKSPPIIRAYGSQTTRPKCAVVVPLYGRHDFMLNQLLAFSDDPDFVAAVELIYVIDDHRLVSPVAVDAPMFEANFGVPFQTIWSGENRGFAGSHESRGRKLERSLRSLDEFGRNSDRARLAGEDAFGPCGSSRDRNARRAPASSERSRAA